MAFTQVKGLTFGGLYGQLVTTKALSLDLPFGALHQIEWFTHLIVAL